MHLLGNPKYVQLIVNPQKAIFGVRSCRADDYRAERIHWDTLGDKQSCEFYSKYLLQTLGSVCLTLKQTEKYTITGTYIQKENLVLFDITNSHTLEEGALADNNG